MDCPRELDLLIRARYPIIYLRTSEESRACNLIANTNAPLSHWNVVAIDRS